MTLRTFNLPDVGEGLTEAEIVQWKVVPGAAVAVNEIICEIETAKSLVELSSPYEGTVSELLVPEGGTVGVGTPIISVDEADDADDADDEHDDEPGTPQDAWVGDEEERARAVANDDGRAAARAGTGVAETAPSPLVGTGPKADAATRRPRKGRQLPSRPVQGRPESSPSHASSSAEGRVEPLGRRSGRVLAKPPVRKAARDLGIDLADVPATGGAGEVTKQDLMGYQSQRDAEQGGAVQRGADRLEAGRAPLGGGRVERIPVKGVRRATARAMVQSAFTAPHVSIFVDVDASRTMEFVKRLKAARDFEGVKVSPLLILARAVIWAAARNPSVNATWSEDEILVKHFVNLGIAAATPRGLMVPNIRDAQDLSLRELALALDELVATARAGRTQPALMQGGSLTITNIGALGVDAGTPIINPGEVAIVALGTIRQKPWVVDGEVVPRWITTLGGSFDHRVVDGDLGARFLTDVASILEEPALLLD